MTISSANVIGEDRILGGRSAVRRSFKVRCPYRIGSGIVVLALALSLSISAAASAQTSSLGAKQRKADANRKPEYSPREAPKIERNRVYEQHSWVTVRAKDPKAFRVGDLITIVVREQRRFEADSALETKKKLNITSELAALFKLSGDRIVPTTFSHGKPEVDFSYDNKLKSEADSEREDQLTLRVSGSIIDVKPNGLLVLEAQAHIQYDDELSVITLTGMCRKEDVTADNTVLSTQIADKHVVVDNEGALRAASTRGWIPKLIDLVKPF